MKEGAGGRGGGQRGERGVAKHELVCITNPLAGSSEHLMGNYYGKWDGEAVLTPKQTIKKDLGGCLCGCGFERLDGCLWGAQEGWVVTSLHG